MYEFEQCETRSMTRPAVHDSQISVIGSIVCRIGVSYKRVQISMSFTFDLTSPHRTAECRLSELQLPASLDLPSSLRTRYVSRTLAIAFGAVGVDSFVLASKTFSWAVGAAGGVFPGTVVYG